MMLVWVVTVCLIVHSTNVAHLMTKQLLPFYTQHRVRLVSCNWWEVALLMKARLRSASTMHGVLCVMIPGIIMMQLWCVISWDTLHKVSNTKIQLFRVILVHSLLTSDGNNFCYPPSSYLSIKITVLNNHYTHYLAITLKSIKLCVLTEIKVLPWPVQYEPKSF